MRYNAGTEAATRTSEAATKATRTSEAATKEAATPAGEPAAADYQKAQCGYNCTSQPTNTGSTNLCATSNASGSRLATTSGKDASSELATDTSRNRWHTANSVPGWQTDQDIIRRVDHD